MENTIMVEYGARPAQPYDASLLADELTGTLNVGTIRDTMVRMGMSNDSKIQCKRTNTKKGVSSEIVIDGYEPVDGDSFAFVAPAGKKGALIKWVSKFLNLFN